ncbi:PREDICTED: B3 domain-containing protein Os01g0234100-like isoform X3 [Ipomoea nil]|uniref:B3 domain-containing protein Os01g0234100-like isoform X3 n=1 Tax=Ipomoea nil TaxID=35883 RepID=UPI000901E8BA|nr:PREDICTED: B3 domain-containing protein Os01g0234100-like isoform X3 [Ipomoea nil]
MKIKVVLNQENRGDPDMPKKEIVEDERAEPEEEDATRDPNEENLSLVNIPNSSPSPLNSYPQHLGKRKRKPKEMIDEISPLVLSRKRKKKLQPSAAQSSHEGPGGKGKSPSPLQVKSPTLIRAEEVQSSLGQEYPTFLKLLVRSHVGSCFWMGLPVPFCKKYLSRKDTTVVVENENGEEFEIKYIAEKTGLSAGWRKFVAAHKLVEGDVLIFQLTGPDRFKVYVIRTNDLTDVDGALSLLNLEVLTKQSDAEATNPNNKRKKRQKSLPLTVVQRKKHKAQLVQLEEQSGNDSDEVASEVFEGSKALTLAASFGDVKSFEDFTIVVNGVCLDSEIPDHIRRKYYELCCSKNAFLHDRLLSGLYGQLIAGMIFEVVSIADAIRACKLTTARTEFEVWDKSLKSFELLGMNVGFLRDRVRQLLNLAFESEGASDAKRYWEAKTGLARSEEEIKTIEIKLVELKEASKVYSADIEALRSKAESFEIMFDEEINAPW